MNLMFTAAVRLITLASMLFILGSCHSEDEMSVAYRQVGANLNQHYHLTGGDVILTYDLGRINNADTIYAKDLGLIISDDDYRQDYQNKFNVTYKSPTDLRREAIRKILKISKILKQLHAKYKILSYNEYQYIKRLDTQDLIHMDARYELTKLDKIMKRIPILLPECSPRITSHYGRRKHPVTKKYKFHCGIDLYGKKAAPIFASAEGKVIFTGRRNGYGNFVEISHGRGIVSKYAHLKNIEVKKGQQISRGQLIGRQGRSGKVTSEHLHYEIWVNGNHVNPYDFISCECKCRR